VRLSDAGHVHPFTTQNVLIVDALLWACCRHRAHSLAHACTSIMADQIPRFFAQVDLVWKKMKTQYDGRAVAELNKELRYIVSFSSIMPL